MRSPLFSSFSFPLLMHMGFRRFVSGHMSVLGLVGVFCEAYPSDGTESVKGLFQVSLSRIVL